MTEKHTPDREDRRALAINHCGWEACRPGHSFGPAVRDHYLFHFVLQGTGSYRCRGRDLAVGPGEGFLILPGERTFYQADAKNPWEYVWVGFEGYEARRVLEDCGLGDRQLLFRAADPGALGEELLALYRLFQQPAGSYALLAQFYRAVARMEQPRIRRQGGVDYFEEAADYIRRNYSYNLQIGELARQVGVDRTYLYKLFQREAGVSPQEYLIRCRLTAACGLLQNTRLTAAEIAYSCGFLDVPSFYKQFQRRYGQTPIKYRQSCANKKAGL